MKPHMASQDVVSTSRISLILRLSFACYETLGGVLEQMVAHPERPISTIRISRNPNRRSRKDLPLRSFLAERPT